jgi:putative DNA primase/helicase
MNEEMLSALRGRLGGKPVFLCVPKGGKGPVTTNWQNTTLEESLRPEYIQRLLGSNIGVLLGKASGNLCTIDIDSDSRAEEFAADNPKLAKTFQTKGARGRNFWVIVKGEYPELSKIKAGQEDWGEWRSNGGQTIVFGMHPSGISYSYPNRGANVIEIGFDEIVWPKDVSKPWEQEAARKAYEKLTQEWGDPFKTKLKEDEEIIVGLNEPFWGARYFTENKILWEPTEKRFYMYDVDTGLWDTKSEDSIKQEISKDILELGRSLGQPSTQEMRSERLLTAIVRQLRGMVEIKDAFNNRGIPGVHCANSYLTFDEDGNIQEHEFSPDFYSRNQSPIEFQGIDLEPKRFLAELVRPTLSCDDDIAIFQKYGGMCLYGRNIIQRFMVMYGQAGGGKSTLVNVILNIVGKHNMAGLRTGHLNNQFELYRFRAKTLLSGTDVPGNFLSTPGAKVIKGLTGGDTIEAEGKGLNDGVVLQGIFNILITANERLKVALEGDVEAWGRRLLLLEFPNPPPTKKIDGFADKLVAEEGPAILAWFLRGFRDLLADVRDAGDIRLSPEQLDKTRNLLAESDSVTHFIRDRVHKVHGHCVTNDEFITLYGEYCAERGWVAMEQARLQKVINAKMLELRQVTQSHSVEAGKGKNKRGFRNIRVDGQERHAQFDY